MTRLTTRYHSAAQDARLDILKEATRKDCDTSDEDGMTPVLWAAFKGHLEALRVLMGRGGNPDKTDVCGNTALHCAAANGHLPCVTFLVNFGANVWSLDNDFHSPLQLAAICDHSDIVTYLDDICDSRARLSKKTVQKLRQKAMEQAEKRSKQCEKRLEENARRAEKDQNLRRGLTATSTPTSASASHTGKSKHLAPPLSRGGIVTPGSTVVLRSTNKAKVTNPLALEHATQRMKSYSEHFPNMNGGEESNGRGTTRSGAVAKKTNKKKVYEPNVFYGNPSDLRAAKDWDTRSYTSRALSEPDLLVDQWETETLRAPRPARPLTELDSDGRRIAASGDAEPGLFVRPGFGSVAFLSRPNVQENPTPTPWTDQDPRNGHSHEEFVTATRTSEQQMLPASNSIGSTGSLEHRANNYPEGDSPDLAEEEGGNMLPGGQAVQAMEVFLAANGLTQLAGRLAEEQLDLPALLLCSEQDLQEIGLGLGPRRKLLDAVQRRRTTLENPGPIQDSYL